MNEEALKEFESLDIEPLIADRPAEPRDSSRLLVVDRGTGELSDRRFSDLPEFLTAGDMLVLNRSRVWKARLEAAKLTGGRCELLLMAPREGDRSVWSALCRKVVPGQTLNCPAGLKAQCLQRNQDGSYDFRFSAPVDEAYLAANGSRCSARRGKVPDRICRQAGFDSRAYRRLPFYGRAAGQAERRRSKNLFCYAAYRLGHVPARAVGRPRRPCHDGRGM